MHSLTNVPAAAATDREIVGLVDGPNIAIVNRKKRAELDDWWKMTDIYVGDHMLANPEHLRQLFADTVATAIRMGRDAGYRQAKAEIRQCLGIKD